MRAPESLMDVLGHDRTVCAAEHLDHIRAALVDYVLRPGCDFGELHFIVHD
jgi:hypothetical protein